MYNNSMFNRPNMQNQHINNPMNMGQNQGFGSQFFGQPTQQSMPQLYGQPNLNCNYFPNMQQNSNNLQQNKQTKPIKSKNSKNSSTPIPQNVENCGTSNIQKNVGWVVDDLSFCIETNSIELVINLENSTIGKTEKNNAKAAKHAIKYIEKLIDEGLEKKEDNDEIQTLKNELKQKNEEINLLKKEMKINDKQKAKTTIKNDNKIVVLEDQQFEEKTVEFTEKNNIALQILKMHTDHMNEVKTLKNEIKQKIEENKLLMRKVDDLNNYRIKFLEQENELKEMKEFKQNNNKDKQLNKVEQVNEDLIDFLQEMEKPDPNKNTKLMSTMGMSVAIDKIGSLFEIYRPKEQNNDKKIKEYESNSETSEFDLLDVENGKEKKNKEIEIEEKETEKDE